MSKKISVLYVDDEENNLISFHSFFRKEYQMFTATNAADAFTILEKNDINIIVTDQKMPLVTGVEFLEQTIEKYPDAIRLLITGYTELKLVIEAINKGQIHKYIEKPWDWDKLKLILENCADLYLGRIALKQKNDELQKTNDELNRFIYSASHDLRSPLTSIMGILQLARLEENLTMEYLEIIDKNIQKLDKYIKNIISYYQNSRSEERLENINFKQMIDQEIEMLTVNDSDVIFEVNIQQNIEFIGDHFRIRLVINNLLSNAIKYRNPEAAEHKIKIDVDVNKTEAIITISDNGLGIHEDHLENIFKMFYRAQGHHSKQGSGLGLFIVKESIEKLEGSVNVKSKPLIGTIFEVKTPNKLNLGQ
jgi:signal transduction histidine kinase